MMFQRLYDRVCWWFSSWRYWYRMWQPKQCDGCDGSFRLGDLAACSGDYWLCQKCFKRWMEPF